MPLDFSLFTVGDVWLKSVSWESDFADDQTDVRENTYATLERQAKVVICSYRVLWPLNLQGPFGWTLTLEAKKDPQTKT